MQKIKKYSVSKPEMEIIQTQVFSDYQTIERIARVIIPEVYSPYIALP